MAAAAVLILGSCSEGQYWNEPADKGQVVAFAKPAATVTVPATGTAPSSYTVTVYRSQTNGELTVPVELIVSDTTGVLSGPANVTFENGKNTADYTLSIGDLMPGVTYSASLGVEAPDSTVLTHPDAQNLKFTFNISQALSWTPAGTAALQSSWWVGNEVPAEVQIEEGNWPVAGERLFRLVQPYYVLDPDYTKKGYEIRFYTDEAGNALKMANDWTYIGVIDDGDYLFFGCPAEYGCQFISQGNEYLMHGVIGYAGTLTGKVTPWNYEQLYFVWDCPKK